MTPDFDASEKAQRLVAWKRHEQPPPGFFEFLPVRILGRIEELESSRRQPWWTQWLGIFESQPVLLGALGTGVCGLFLLGISLSEWVVPHGNPTMASYRWVAPAEVETSLVETKHYGRTPASIAFINSGYIPGTSASSPAVYTRSGSLPIQPAVYSIPR